MENVEVIILRSLINELAALLAREGGTFLFGLVFLVWVLFWVGGGGWFVFGSFLEAKSFAFLARQG